MTEPLSRAWEVWAAQNLMRGVPRVRVEERLVAEGLGAEEARATVDAFSSSPLFEAAQPIARDARRWQMLAKLDATLAREVSRPTEVLRRASISAADLRDVYRAARIPVVMGDVVRPWRAMTTWAPRALAERFADVEVACTVSRQEDATYAQTFRRPSESMTVRALVDRMEASTAGDFYVVAQNHALRGPLGAMLEDVSLPEGYLDAPLSERASLWMGPANTVTALHHDRVDVLFCQVYGRKRWRLIAPTERALYERVRGIASTLDPASSRAPSSRRWCWSQGTRCSSPWGPGIRWCRSNPRCRSPSRCTPRRRSTSSDPARRERSRAQTAMRTRLVPPPREEGSGRISTRAAKRSFTSGTWETMPT